MRSAALFTLMIVLLTACKKGKDDPFLSFKSRDKRLQQEWVLENLYYNKKNESNGNVFIDEKIFSEGTLTRTHTENGNSTVFTDPCEITLNIKKDGEYIYTLTNYDESITYKLPWNWMDTDKKKTRIKLWDFEYTYNYEPLMVDRLSSKELVLSSYTISDQPFSKTTCEVRLTFKRKN